MLYYVYLTNNGAPATGLSPTWNALDTAENGTDKSGSAPSITEVGGGWYKFDVVFGTAPWDVTDEDLVGSIDGGSSLATMERYKPVAITKRGLALSVLAHKGIQTKSTGDVVYYDQDDTTAAFKADMTNAASTITRALAAPS